MLPASLCPVLWHWAQRVRCTLKVVGGWEVGWTPSGEGPLLPDLLTANLLESRTSNFSSLAMSQEESWAGRRHTSGYQGLCLLSRKVSAFSPESREHSSKNAAPARCPCVRASPCLPLQQYGEVTASTNHCRVGDMHCEGQPSNQKAQPKPLNDEGLHMRQGQLWKPSWALHWQRALRKPQTPRCLLLAVASRMSIELGSRNIKQGGGGVLVLISPEQIQWTNMLI